MAFLKCVCFKAIRKSTKVLVEDSADRDFQDDQKPKIVDGVSIKVYNWDDITRLTRNFSRVVGTGGFSTVYLARFQASSLGAVKVHKGSERLIRAFKQELDILLRLRHDHIVKLLGYCDDREEEGALVFEYVPNGTLQEKLHGEEKETVPWKNRMTIAFQLAQAIEYLHDKCALQIVHGDLKASNVLLDHRLNCKLCDFGFAKMGFSSTVLPPAGSPSSPTLRTRHVMMGSPGYTDPIYLRTGIASKKNDVYSFGVLVLELVTGMEAFSCQRGMLTSIVAPALAESGDQLEPSKVAEMVDPRLGGNFDPDEAKAMLCLAASCLRQSPTLRPSATQILHTITHKIPSVSFPETPTKASAKANGQLPIHSVQ